MTTKLSTHKQLAEKISGKSILLLNSLGKDSALCLEWLYNYAKPARIVSLHFRQLAPNPDDEIYKTYLKNKYQGVEFIEVLGPFDVMSVIQGEYQYPLDIIENIHEYEYGIFDYEIMADDIRKELSLDYLCLGHSKYESFARAKLFHDKGLLIDTRIYPIGLMSKSEVISLIHGSGLKVHPCYSYAQATLDQPSYFKYAKAFKKYPKWEQEFMNYFPMLELDKYRYEVLFGKKP